MDWIQSVNINGDIEMKCEKNDISELYESINLKTSAYVEFNENDSIINIKSKWLIINEIVSIVNEYSSTSNNRTA
ncbi:MAG: hypothetical protein WCG16_02980 [Methylococcales bacterium]